MTVPTSALQRTYYYDAELLQLADFVREQQYVRDLVRYQNASIFAPGVVSGLALSGAGTVITVAEGMGFDGSGVPLFAQSTTLDITSLSLKAGTYSVQLAYGDNLLNTTVLQQTHLIIEQPVIQVVVPPATPTAGILLGTITVGSNGAISGTATTGLQKSGIYLAPATPPAAGPNAPLAMAVAAPAAPAPAAASGAQRFTGPLTVGTGAPEGAALLSVSQQLDGQPDGASVARFDFTGSGVTDAGVSLGVKTATGVALIAARYAGNQVWELSEDGTARTLSDASLKVDVEPLAGALERARALRPVSFAWRSDPARRRHLGLLAQEVTSVVPEIVGATSEGRQTLAYQELVPLLIQAIHELENRVVELEAERDSA